MVGAMLSKSLIQFSVDEQGCVPSLLFDLRPNCGGSNEGNGDLLQKVSCTHCHTQCPQACSKPPPTHTSSRDSWTLTGKSESVSRRVTAQSLVGSLLLSYASMRTTMSMVCSDHQQNLRQLPGKSELVCNSL